MNYQEWERCIPGDIAGDVLWKVQVYRLALFLYLYNHPVRNVDGRPFA